jgi:O-antigen/teichoic acid export membrane protein
LSILLTNGWYAFGFIAAVACYSIFALQDMALTGLRQTHWVPVENTLFSIAKLVLLLVLVGTSLQLGILLSFLLPLVLVILPLNWFLFRRWVPHHMTHSAQTEHLPLSQIARFVGGDYVGQLFALAGMALLPLMVTNRLGADANAYFYLAWVVAGSLQLLNVNFAISLTVEAALDEQALAKYTRNMLLHSLRLLVPVVVALLLFAPWLLTLFGKSYAEESVTVLRLLVFAALPHNLIALWLGIARVRRQIKQIILVQAANCVLLLGASAALMNVYGITGVGLGVLLAETIIAALLLVTQIHPLLLNRTHHPVEVSN